MTEHRDERRKTPGSVSAPNASSDNAVASWITDELMELTRTVWQPFYPVLLTDDEVRAMLTSVGHLCRALSSRAKP